MSGTSHTPPSQRFRISLDRTGQVYHPGDTVTGRVVLQSPEDEEVVNVNIVFSGRSKTKLSLLTGQTVQIYRDRASLFSISQDLFPNQYKLRRDTLYEWPFSFIFPAWTESDRATEYETGPSPPHEFLTGPHSLPPTYYLDLKPSYGYVRYALDASVGRKSNPLTATEILTFSPSFDPSALDETMVTNEVSLKHATSRLEHEVSSRTLKEVLRDGLKSSMGLSIPTAIFRVHVSVPKVIVLGDSPSILLMLFYDPESTTTTPPHFSVRINSIRLKTQTVVRGTHEGLFGAKADKIRETSETFDLKSHWIHAPTTSPSGYIDIPPEIPLELRAHWPDDATTLYPDFKCFSLSNTHTLQATVTVNLAAKEFTHEFPASKVTILPSRPPDENSIAAQIQAASALENLTPLLPPPSLNGNASGPGPSSPASASSHTHSQQSQSIRLRMSRTDSDEGMKFPAEETIQTERGLMLRYGPPTGIAMGSAAQMLSSSDPLVPVRKSVA